MLAGRPVNGRIRICAGLTMINTRHPISLASRLSGGPRRVWGAAEGSAWPACVPVATDAMLEDRRTDAQTPGRRAGVRPCATISAPPGGGVCVAASTAWLGWTKLREIEKPIPAGCFPAAVGGRHLRAALPGSVPGQGARGEGLIIHAGTPGQSPASCPSTRKYALLINVHMQESDAPSHERTQGSVVPPARWRGSRRLAALMADPVLVNSCTLTSS